MQIQAHTLNEVLSYTGTPFKDSSYQGCKTAGKLVYHLTLSGLNYAAYGITKLFNSEMSELYWRNSVTHEQRSRVFDTYITQEDLIDFSVNIPRQGLSVISDVAKDRLEALYNQLPRETINELMIFEPEHGWAINKEKMNTDLSRGICCGMGLHFVFCILKELQHGKSIQEAVERIAPIYSQGAPEMAQLLQILHQSQNSEEIYAKMNQLLDDARDEIDQLSPTYSIYKFLECILCILWYLITFKDLTVLIDSYRIETEQIMDRLRESTDPILCNEIQNQVMGLQSKKFRFKKTDSINTFIRELPVGVYHADLRLEKRDEGHRIGFIKMDGKFYLFEPNFGTFSLDESKCCEKILYLFGRYKASLANFYQCSLKDIL